jgi:glycosyltransferase involved in cell wall biosynthesis
MTKLLQNAACLVFPSQYYENLPMTIVEAFASGTPVIASRLGSLQEIVQDGVNGLHFTPGDTTHLAAQVKSMLSDSQRLQAMRKSARSAYEQRYTVQRNYISLMELYKSVILPYKKASTLSL